MNKKRIQQIKCLFTLCLLCFFLPNPLFSQNSNPLLTIKAENERMEKVMRSVESQTKFLFIASGIDVSSSVTVDVTDGTIQEVLGQMLESTDLAYQIDDRYIILSRKESHPVSVNTVSGEVRDSSGPVWGATVVVPGTTKGTTTDAQGRFSLTGVSRGETVQVSFIGYRSQEIVYTGQTSLNFSLSDDVTEIDQVVVTALGIKREQKALSYNVQQINQDDITAIKDANLINSLTGKVAGATINQSSSGIGGAVKVVMRGVKSIEQNNNALYVIDGIPMYNFGGGGSTEFGSQGATESIADINPDDIESISVLTGAAAAALYGSNAANGAIIITTKRGEAGTLKVSVSSATEFLNPLMLPDFQNRYGTGSGGRISGSSVHSWGPLLNEASYQGYNPKDFFNTGAVYNNSVTLSGGSETNQVFFSSAAINSEGIIPNTRYNRYNFTFRNSTQFLEGKLKLDVSASYIMQDDRNMTNQGVYSNPLVSAYLFPRGDDFAMAKIFERFDPARKIKTMYWPQGEGGDLRMQNPYWIAYRNLRENNKKRYMLSASLGYEVTDWLNVSGRVRVDNANNQFEQKFYASTNTTLTEGSSQGFYSEAKSNDRQIYADVIATFDKRVGDFSFNANVGASISDIKADMSSYGGPIREEGIPNVFTVYDLDRTKSRAKRERWQEQTQSIFANVEVGWRSMVYLTLTGRNDWASQLANSPESSFFYPSVGLSGIISEMVRMPEQINYLKLRTSYSSVGSPFPRHLTSPTYEYDDVNQTWKPKTHYPIGKLYPERTNSFEIGLDIRLFRHFSLSGSYYRSNTKNQTFDPQISVSSGYSTIYLQTGHVRNTGAEAMLGYSNTWNGFTWDTGVTFSWNKNKIIELVSDYEHPETGELITKDRLEIKGLGKAKYILKTGGTLGDLYSQSSLVTDAYGNYVMDDNGALITTDNHSDIYLGSVFPKYNMGWRTYFGWKGISAGAVITGRVGGIVYSASRAAMDQFGVSEATALARDRGGVLVNGRSRIEAETWYSAIGAQSGIPQYYTYSATNVRLQEASIGYTIPREKLGNVLSITVSFVGRNLWMIYCKAPVDPEAVATTDNFYQGIDYFMIPSTRNLGFSVKINF